MLVGSTALPALAQDNPTEEQVPSEQPPSVDLFDGKSLANWAVTEFGTGRAVTVVDGAIELEQGHPLTGITFTGTVPDSEYEIELEAKKIAGNDFFCALTFPVEESHCTLVLGGWGGTVTGLSCLDGADASENATTRFIRYERNRWYAVRVRVADGRIQAWLDGESIVDVPYRGKKVEVRNEVQLSRPLGICSFATTAHLRHIRLRDFDP